MLEAKRQFEEEQGPGADKAQVKSTKAIMENTAKDQVGRRVFFFSVQWGITLCVSISVFPVSVRSSFTLVWV